MCKHTLPPTNLTLACTSAIGFRVHVRPFTLIGWRRMQARSVETVGISTPKSARIVSAKVYLLILWIKSFNFVLASCSGWFTSISFTKLSTVLICQENRNLLLYFSFLINSRWKSWYLWLDVSNFLPHRSNSILNLYVWSRDSAVFRSSNFA